MLFEFQYSTSMNKKGPEEEEINHPNNLSKTPLTRLYTNTSILILWY